MAEVELAGGSRNLPATLQNLIRRRLEGLPRKTSTALGAASVIGRRFDLALLQRITSQPAPALMAALDRAQLLGVIEPGERMTEYSFRHDLIRDAIRKVWLRRDGDGPVGLWDGVPRRTSVEHDTVHDEPLCATAIAFSSTAAHGSRSR